MDPLSKKMVAWVGGTIGIATAVLVVWLWWIGTRGLEGEKLVTARFDALRTGLSIGLGGGGLFALYLAWRRQHSAEVGLTQKQQDQADVARAYALQERTALANEADATARRITDLYTKAVEQLGSGKAPVRLGGLYALERLAQDHVEQRQTIVNVLCAYLRMPYTLPGVPPADDADDKLVNSHTERIQEREVRLTAQRILAHHLRPGTNASVPAETFWADIELDLAGATLIDLDFRDCLVGGAQFTNATFNGEAQLHHVNFTSDARFDHATFTSKVVFTGATFTGAAEFFGASFLGETWYVGATFLQNAGFNQAIFTKNVSFARSTFATDAEFIETNFTDQAHFYQAAFPLDAWFSNATFNNDAWFSKATFTGTARFSHATFNRAATFQAATLPSNRYTGRDTPRPWANFEMAQFAQDVPPEVKRFVSPQEEGAGDSAAPN